VFILEKKIAEFLYLHHPSYTTCEISFPRHILPPHFIQPTEVKCICLLIFFIYQPEDGQRKEPKHVVLYVINYTFLYHHIAVLDKYTHSNQVEGNFFVLIELNVLLSFPEQEFI